MRTSENPISAKYGDRPFHALGCIAPEGSQRVAHMGSLRLVHGVDVPAGPRVLGIELAYGQALQADENLWNGVLIGSNSCVTRLPDAGHGAGVHKPTVAEGVAAVGSLYLEAELLVEGHRSGIVGIHRQLDPCEVEPVVREV
jgi:hypothetical protein